MMVSISFFCPIFFLIDFALSFSDSGNEWAVLYERFIYLSTLGAMGSYVVFYLAGLILSRRLPSTCYLPLSSLKSLSLTHYSTRPRRSYRKGSQEILLMVLVAMYLSRYDCLFMFHKDEPLNLFPPSPECCRERKTLQIKLLS